MVKSILLVVGNYLQSERMCTTLDKHIKGEQHRESKG
jgi:hypothetical protein